MDVYFLRHGQAEKQADCDENRVLTSQGEETIRRLGAVLRSRQILPTHLYASPYERTVQTAEILNQSLPQPLDLTTKKRLRCGAKTTKILALLEKHKKEDCIILVGHMPDFAEITQALLHRPKPIGFEPGSLVGLHWASPSALNTKARLLLELHPSQYAV